MPIAEAHVPAANPGRYLIQLCRHAQQAHRLRHQPPAHGGDGAHPRPQVQQVEWSETQGTIGFGQGRCTIQAAPGTLILRAEAADEEHLQQIQQILAADIERFGQRDHVTVSWQRPGDGLTSRASDQAQA
jgi:hypothetical protein